MMNHQATRVKKVFGILTLCVDIHIFGYSTATNPWTSRCGTVLASNAPPNNNNTTTTETPCEECDGDDRVLTWHLMECLYSIIVLVLEHRSRGRLWWNMIRCSMTSDSLNRCLCLVGQRIDTTCNICYLLYPMFYMLGRLSQCFLYTANMHC